MPVALSPAALPAMFGRLAPKSLPAVCTPPGISSPARPVEKLSNQRLKSSALLIDGVALARFAVPPDDGVGERRKVRIYEPRWLQRLSRGTHTLSFRVPDGAMAHGLCIYGDYHGAEPPPAGEFSPILLRYVIGPEKPASNP